MQPATDGAAFLDGSRIVRQHQERRLGRVFSVMGVLEHPPADAIHHRGMALHERGERCLIALLDETREQLPIRRAIGSASARQLADVVQDIPQALARHLTLYL
jgi:hypothetical protein